MDELSAATNRWSVRVLDPKASASGSQDFDYEGYAVRPDGTVLAVDTYDDVVRSFATTDSPSSGGTVVAGIPQASGSPATGASEPATSTGIDPTGPIVAAADGSFDLAEGRHVDHVDAAGVLTRLPDAGADPTDPGNHLEVFSLTADGATVYENLHDYTQGEVQAQPVSGGTAAAILAPSSTLVPSVALLGSGGSARLLAPEGEIEQWPADGSAGAGDGSSYAGLPVDADGGFQSPDGTRLDEAFISDITALAGGSNGSIAIATDGTVRSLSGLSPDSILGTIATGFTATELRWAADGSLYALVADPHPHVVRIAPDGTTHTVLGGGSQAPAAGVSAPDVLADELQFALDPSDGELYFTDNQDDTVWVVDPATLIVEPLAQLPNAERYSAAALIVDAGHDVLADAAYGRDPRPLTRITPSGDESAAGCIDGPTDELEELPDGTLLGQRNGTSDICGPDGTDLQLAASTVAGPLTSDGRMLRPEDPRTGGLLGYTDPITAPMPVDAPTATITAEPGGAAVTVTPSPVSGERITIDGFARSGPRATVTDTFTTDGSGTAVTRHFDDLLRESPAPAGSTAPVWQFDVIADEQNPSGSQITDAPVVLAQQLETDSTPPAAPGLELANEGSTVRLTVTPPGDADLNRIVVCQSTSGAVADPDGCNVAAQLSAPSDYAPFSLDIDPVRTTTFTAFAVDDSGNVSDGRSATRPAAILVAGSAGSAFGYSPAPGGEEVLWTDGGSAGARYALGTAAPTDPDADLEPANFFMIGADGHGDVLPLASGATATVSVFDWTDSTQTAFRRSSFVLRQGTTSDALTLASTTAVDPGRRPVVTARLTRHSPFGGTTPIAGEYVTLYRRPVGANTWQTVSSSTTTTAGSASFTVPAPSGATDYQVRDFLDTDPGQQAFSPIERTCVRQSLAARFPTRVRQGGTLTVTGSVLPRHVETVALQRYVGHAWRTVTSGRTDTRGNYRLSYRPSRGRSAFRVVAAATPALLAGASSPHEVTTS